jgi:hypothetical protein
MKESFDSSYPGVAKMSESVYTLRHIETGEFVCLRQSGHDYLTCFRSGDNAIEFRERLRLVEHVDIISFSLQEAPFDYFYLDGMQISRALVAASMP